ncbi:MAG: HEAT repeat domain-containing protein [Planctomycetota bacterium]|nr:HEAT repeat domain-containing protein [Planctomycetota bacterium]
MTKTSVSVSCSILAFYEDTGDLVPFAFSPSPNGRLLAYVFGEPSGAEGDLWVLSARTGARKCLVWDDHWYWSPSWSPSGDELAICSSRTGAGEVWKVRIEDGQPQLLTNHGKNISHAAWSPDGNRIAFVSSKNGPSELWCMDSDGSNKRVLAPNRLWVDAFQTLGARPPLAVAWSPDSKHLAFTSIEPNISEIERKYRLDPGTFTRWTLRLHVVDCGEDTQSSPKGIFSAALEHRDSGAIRSLSWSPDGGRLAFNLMMNDASSMIIVGTDGVVEHRFDCLGSLSKAPWSADGKTLAFVHGGNQLEFFDVQSGLTTLVDADFGYDASWRDATFMSGARTILAAYGHALVSFALPAAAGKHVELSALDKTSSAPAPELSRRTELETRSRIVRSELESVVVSGDPAMLEFAIAALEDVGFHWLAGRALAAIGAERVQHALAYSLASPDPVVRAGAVKTAELLVDAHGLKPDETTLDRVRKILRGYRREIPQARILAATLLGKADDAEAVRDLMNATLDEDENVRTNAILALGMIGEPMSIPSILSAPLAGKSAYVEFEDILVPLDFGRPEIWPVAHGSIGYGDPVGLAKIKALAAMESAESLATLEKMTDHSDCAMRYWALRLLAGFKGAQLQRVFETALIDPSPAVRSLAISVLQREELWPTKLATPFELEAMKEIRQYEGGDEIRSEICISGHVINRHSSELHRVAAGTCCGDRSQVESLGVIPAGGKSEFLFFFVLPAWEPLPESINIVVESSEGIRQVFPVNLK